MKILFPQDMQPAGIPDGDENSVFMMTIDGTDCPIQEPTPFSKTWFLYGVGNHPANGGSITMLNATAYQSRRWQTFDRPFFWGQHAYMVWVPPHYKLSILKWQDNNDRAQNFLYESARWFAQWRVPTLNFFHLTMEAVPKFCRHCPVNATGGHQCNYYDKETCQATFETFDGYHFGRSINLYKAHLALFHLEHTLTKFQKLPSS